MTLLSALAMLSSLASPTPASHRLAMLVGIDDYGPAYKAEGLNGAHYDVEEMSGMLGDLGFEIEYSKPQNEWTKPTFLAAMKKMGDQAKPGDAVLLYFSGRGSAMAGAGGSVATLVPFGSKSSDGDIPMTAISDWADHLREVQVIVMIDACFVKGTYVDKDLFQQPYNHHPRVIERVQGMGSPSPFTGHAVFLCAALNGSAYEQQPDPNQPDHAGAFTDEVVGTQRELSREGYGFADIFAEIRRKFRRRAMDGFMGDETPAMIDPAQQVSPNTPFLWGAVPPQVAATLPKMRVALVPDAADKGEDPGKVLGDFTKAKTDLIHKLLADNEVAEFVPLVQLPDHVVRAIKKADGWHFKYGGDVDDDLAAPDLEKGTEDQRILTLRNMVLSEAYSTAIYRLSAAVSAPSGCTLSMGKVFHPGADMLPDPPRLLIRINDRFRFFYFSYNPDFGLVHVVYPNPAKDPDAGPNDNVLPPGIARQLPLRLPAKEPDCKEDTLRAVVVPDASGADPGGADLIKRLSSLFHAIQDKKVMPWKTDSIYAVEGLGGIGS